MEKLSKEWVRLAGLYVRASDAVREADRDSRVSAAAYGVLIDARERAFETLQAEGSARRSRA